MNENIPSEIPEFDPEQVIATEIIEHEPPLTDRSAARRGALQVLYELDTTDHKVGDVMTMQLIHNPLPPRASRYLNNLVLGVLARRDDLDKVIQKYAPEFPLEQVAVIDRNILRIALVEFVIRDNVPAKVAIDEAVLLARLFGADGSTRFVNGVLGTLSGDYQAIREELVLDLDADEEEDEA